MRLRQRPNARLDIRVEGNRAWSAGIDVQQHLFACGHRFDALISKHLEVKMQPLCVMPKHAHIDANLRAFLDFMQVVDMRFERIDRAASVLCARNPAAR